MENTESVSLQRSHEFALEKRRAELHRERDQLVSRIASAAVVFRAASAVLDRAQQALIDFDGPRVCPICQDAACETKSAECGR